MVKVGSARSSFGNTKAGDQSGGREVSVQDWYLHSKGWVVLRAKDPKAREEIAIAMEHACANDRIGYDQSTRNMLWNAVKEQNYDPALATKAVNVDCSALVRVCCAYAGIELANFTTGNQRSVMVDSGAFILYTDDAHCKSSRDLLRGDVLVTKTKGHTVVVLDDGIDASSERKFMNEHSDSAAARTLRNGSSGADVKELQEALIALGYDLGAWGTDGDFGDCTEIALKAFQRKSGLEADGIYGKNTHAALVAALAFDEDKPGDRFVKIEGGNCYVRLAPDKDSGEIIGTAKRGMVYPFEGEQSVDGWLKIDFNHRSGWVSGVYGRLVS